MEKHKQYHHLEYLSVEDVIDKIGKSVKCSFSVNNKTHNVNVDSSRLKLFKNNRTCVRCGIVGNIFAIDKQPKGKPHLNLYHFNPETKEYIMMTKDHIVPQSKGGTECLSNLQCMCEYCNEQKGNKNDKELISEDLFFVNLKKTLGRVYTKNKTEETVIKDDICVEIKRREKDIFLLIKQHDTECKFSIPMTIDFRIMWKLIQHNINEITK